MPPGVLGGPVRERSKVQPVASVRLRWSGPNFNWEEFAPDSPLEGDGFELSLSPMPLSPWLDTEATGATFETNAQKGLIVFRDIIQVDGRDVSRRGRRPARPVR
jgi:hypothetical protein